MRRTPLRRLSPLKATVSLARTGFPKPRRKPKGGAFDQPTKARIHDRDLWACVRCGTRESLTVHHRLNRGMGGTTNPDSTDPRNGLTLCAACNELIEANAVAAEQARRRGIKLRPGDALSTPVLYRDGHRWVLTADGGRFPAASSGPGRLQSERGA